MTPITLYTYGTPNGQKASIMLEETGLPYRVEVVDIEAGAQRRPEFAALNPHNKIPVVVDHDRGRTVAESGSILFYLARRSGVLLPASEEEYDAQLRWVLFQAAHVGPVLGKIWDWKIFAAEKIPEGIARFEREANRVFTVLDGELGKRAHLAGAEFGIADVMTWPWLRIVEPTLKIDLSSFQNLKRWLGEVGERPGVRRGVTVPGPLAH